jgi:putative N6-adenine-specific DNA methylase
VWPAPGALVAGSRHNCLLLAHGGGGGDGDGDGGGGDDGGDAAFFTQLSAHWKKHYAGWTAWCSRQTSSCPARCA